MIYFSPIFTIAPLGTAATEETFDDGLGGAYNAWATSAFVADIVQNSFGKPQISLSEEAYSSDKSKNLAVASSEYETKPSQNETEQ